MNGDTTERISQESHDGEPTSNGLLEKASTFSQNILESIQALAGTTACKGVQIARLIKAMAIENNHWITKNNKGKDDTAYILAFYFSFIE